MNAALSIRAPMALLLASALLPAAAQAQAAPGPIDPDTGELVSTLPKPSADRCRLPVAPAGAQILLHGAHKGAALSSAAVSGQDQVTTHSYVDIEPGSTPLYLVLSSASPMVWSLRGDTGRVRQVALVSRAGTRDRPAVGVVGAPAARVAVTHGQDCFAAFHEAASEEAGAARSMVGRVLGRAPDRVTGAYAATSVSLPAGRVTEGGGAQAAAPAGLDPALWRSGLRFYPGGVAQVNAGAVAGARAEAYQVLPSHMGLAQLAARGAVRPLGAGEFRIQSPIARYPAGLAGSESVRFQLAQGVAAPGGDPGHACVVRAGGQVLANPLLCALPRRPAPTSPRP